MAVLVIFRAKGNSQDLLARYDATLVDAIATAPSRPEAHFCAPTGDGIMIMDIWSSRAEVQRAIIDNQDFQRKWKEAGWPEETEVHSSGWPSGQLNLCSAAVDQPWPTAPLGSTAASFTVPLL